MSDTELPDDLDIGFKNGSIRLEQIPNVYYSGQTVNGSLIFDLRRPLRISAIYIQYVGEANVLWTECETVMLNGDEQEQDVDYKGREEYFNYIECLAGGEGGTTELPRTYQNFPFRFQIPFKAPSSFKGERGSVSYSITATMVYPDNTKEELKKDFSVVCPLDLNNGSPSIKQPIDLEFEEVYSCCCGSDPISVRMRLPVSGYCPGQAIPIAIEVQNNSSIEITKMVFEILTRECYRSLQPASEYIPPEQILRRTKRGAVMAHTKRNFTCDVTVPHILPPYLEHCSIIDVGYFLRITIKLSGCTDDIQDEAEICLGLVPIKELLEQEYHHPMAHSLPPGPIPVDDGTSQPLPTMNPPINQPIMGSNTSIHRSHQNIVQSSQTARIDAPPPYPGLRMPFPGVNVVYPPPNPNAPKATYEIGFRLPGSSENMIVPPYPTGNAMHGPPYPTDSGIQGPPYPAGSGMHGPPYPVGSGMHGPPHPTISVVNAPPYPTSGAVNSVNNDNELPTYAQVAFPPTAPTAD